MVYPNVKTPVSVPNGTPSGTLFVDVGETYGKGLRDPKTGKIVPIEDCARGYWSNRNLISAHASSCGYLAARMKGKILGVWKIVGKKWNPSLPAIISTRPITNVPTVQKSICNLCNAEPAIQQIVGRRVKLGRCFNSLRGYFCCLLCIATTTIMCGCSKDPLPEEVALEMLNGISEGKFENVKKVCSESVYAELEMVRNWGYLKPSQARWSYEGQTVYDNRLHVIEVCSSDDAYSKKINKIAVEIVDNEMRVTAIGDDVEKKIVSIVNGRNIDVKRFGPQIYDVTVVFTNTEFCAKTNKGGINLKGLMAETVCPFMFSPIDINTTNELLRASIVKRNGECYIDLVRYVEEFDKKKKPPQFGNDEESAELSRLLAGAMKRIGETMADNLRNTDAYTLFKRIGGIRAFLKWDGKGCYTLVVTGVKAKNKDLLKSMCKARGLVTMSCHKVKIFDNQLKKIKKCELLSSDTFKVTSSIYGDDTWCMINPMVFENTLKEKRFDGGLFVTISVDEKNYIFMANYKELTTCSEGIDFKINKDVAGEDVVGKVVGFIKDGGSALSVDYGVLSVSIQSTILSE